MVVMTTRGRAVVLVVALALAASLLTLAVVLAKPAQAQAQTFTDTFQGPLTTLVKNPCTGEAVLLEGTQNLVVHTTIDANGGFHFLTRGNAEVQGESASGVKYVAHQTLQERSNSESATTYTFTNTFQVIRQGSATPTPDDFVLKEVTHVTVNANGEITSVVNEFNEEPCI
jgi:hypothetical protein